MFLGIDNYSAPYEQLPEQEWQEVTKVLNRNLYKAVRRLLSWKRITRALFFGNSETAARASRWGLRRTFSVNRPRLGMVDEARDDSDGEDRESRYRMPFSGVLSDWVINRSREQLKLQDILGMTETEIKALGQVVLGSAERLWNAINGSLTPTTYEDECWHRLGYPVVPVYAYTEVFATLRLLLCRQTDGAMDVVPAKQ